MDESDDRIDLGWVLKSRDPNFKLAFPAGNEKIKDISFQGIKGDGILSASNRRKRVDLL